MKMKKKCNETSPAKHDTNKAAQSFITYRLRCWNAQTETTQSSLSGSFYLPLWLNDEDQTASESSRWDWENAAFKSVTPPKYTVGVKQNVKQPFGERVNSWSCCPPADLRPVGGVWIQAREAFRGLSTLATFTSFYTCLLAAISWNPLFSKSQREYLQVGQARLAHRGRNGFDGCQHGVDELRQLAGGPLGMAARLDDEPGQGPYVRVKGRLLRHAQSWSLCPCWWALDWAGDGEQVSELITSRVFYVPRAVSASQGIYLCVQQRGRRVCVCVCVFGDGWDSVRCQPQTKTQFNPTQVLLFNQNFCSVFGSSGSWAS